MNGWMSKEKAIVLMTALMGAKMAIRSSDNLRVTLQGQEAVSWHQHSARESDVQ